MSPWPPSDPFAKGALVVLEELAEKESTAAKRELVGRTAWVVEARGGGWLTVEVEGVGQVKWRQKRCRLASSGFAGRAPPAAGSGSGAGRAARRARCCPDLLRWVQGVARACVSAVIAAVSSLKLRPWSKQCLYPADEQAFRKAFRQLRLLANGRPFAEVEAMLPSAEPCSVDEADCRPSVPYGVAMTIKQGRRELVLVDANDRKARPAQRSDLSKHAFRVYGRDRFLYVAVKGWPSRREIRDIGLQPIALLGRRYVFAFQNDERAVFFAETGPGLRPKTVAELREELIPLGFIGAPAAKRTKENRNMALSSYAKRFKLSFSDTYPTAHISPDQIRWTRDCRSKVAANLLVRPRCAFVWKAALPMLTVAAVLQYARVGLLEVDLRALLLLIPAVFVIGRRLWTKPDDVGGEAARFKSLSDGASGISRQLMEKVAAELQLHYVPSWVQARLASAASENADCGTGAWAKGVWYVAEDLDGACIEVSEESQRKFSLALPAGASHVLEVCRYAEDPASEAEDVAPSWALLHLLVSAGVPQEVLQAKLQQPAGDPGTPPAGKKQKQTWTLPHSERVTILPDRSGKLRPGQVAFWSRKTQGFFVGPLLLYRDPGLRRADLQLVQAVEYKERIMASECALILPSHPDCRMSLAEGLAGGDFDGDTVTAFWDPELLKHVRPEPIAEPSSHASAAHRCDVGSFARRPHDLDSALREQFAHCVVAGRDVFKVYEAWMKAAEYRGPNSEAAKLLAEQYSLVLDGAETGHRLPRDIEKTCGLSGLRRPPYYGVEQHRSAGQDYAEFTSVPSRLWKARVNATRSEDPGVQT